MIACFVAASAAASAIPGLPEVLEYDRAAVSRGQVWRAATGQLVHWSFAMAGFLWLLLMIGLTMADFDTRGMS